MKKRIVIIEGQDAEYVTTIEIRLQEAGFHVSRYSKNFTAEGDTADWPTPEILLIDTEQRGVEEITLLIRLEWDEGLLPYPVIAVSGKPSTKGLLEAFSAGANDYVSKMASVDELLARIHNLLALFRRITDDECDNIQFDELHIETKKRKVFRARTEIPLTPKEYDLLLYLARHKNKVCSRERLLQEVWGYDFTVKTNVVDVYIKHIRSKLDAGRRRKFIHTVRGAGYMIQ